MPLAVSVEKDWQAMQGCCMIHL